MAKPQPAEPELATLPTAVRELLVRARAGLKENKTTYVTLGWPEVRGIYALWISLGKARLARDSWKKRFLQTSRNLDETVKHAKEDLDQIDVLDNRSTVALLLDIRAILAGNDIPEIQIHETRNRVDTLIKRASARTGIATKRLKL